MTKSGRYRYDEALGKVVKVDDRIPRLSKGGSAPAPEAGPCGRPVSACRSRGCGS